MLEENADLWRFAPDTLLKALVQACEQHGNRLDAEIEALIQSGGLKAVRQPWGSSTTASGLKDPVPTIYRLRNELESELPATLGKLLRLAQLEQQRQYIERSGKKSRTPADELSGDLPARIAAALTGERKAAMPTAAVFHAAFTRAYERGQIEQDYGSAAPIAESPDGASGILTTGFILPPADFERSGRPIPRPFWDAVRHYPFHCPLDLAVGDGTSFEWEDDPMPRFDSYDLMKKKDPAFTFWADEARQRFSDLSIHIGMMRDIPRGAQEETWQWADRAYGEIVKRTGAEMPDRNLSQLVHRDYDIVLDDERGRIWWRWAERHWAIQAYLLQQHSHQATDDPFDDDLVAVWLFLLVGRHTTDEWLQPAWLRARLFDWRVLPLFAAPVSAVRYLVPRTALVPDDAGLSATD